MTHPAPEVRPYGKGFAIYAGRSQLSRGFYTQEAAQLHLENNAEFFGYWAGSPGVSVENATKVRVIEG